MKCNWERTNNNNKVAAHNYYGGISEQMAEIAISAPYAGRLATFWCPVRYKESLATKALVKARELKGTVRVSHPLPDIEGAGRPLFDDYVLE